MHVISKPPQSTSSTPAGRDTVAFMRRPRVVAALVISATVLLGSVAVVAWAAGIEAETRARADVAIFQIAPSGACTTPP